MFGSRVRTAGAGRAWLQLWPSKPLVQDGPVWRAVQPPGMKMDKVNIAGPQPQTKQCFDGSTVPADQPCPQPPPPSELKLRYGDPYFGGIPAFVLITNNDNKPPVGCLYRDGINSINFTISGSAETRIDIRGIPTGTNYHVTVTCDNGLSTSQDKIF